MVLNYTNYVIFFFSLKIHLGSKNTVERTVQFRFMFNNLLLLYLKECMQRRMRRL